MEDIHNYSIPEKTWKNCLSEEVKEKYTISQIEKGLEYDGFLGKEKEIILINYGENYIDFFKDKYQGFFVDELEEKIYSPMPMLSSSQKEMLEDAGFDLKHIETLIDSCAFDIEFCEEKGFRIFDPHNLICKNVYRKHDGYTYWSNG